MSGTLGWPQGWMVRGPVALLLGASCGALAQQATFRPLGSLPGATFYSRARALSADGRVVVGLSQSGAYPEGEPFMWTSAGGMVGLGMLPGRAFGAAQAVSADGHAIAGYCYSASSEGEAFLWTPGRGMVGLGDLPGGAFYSTANAMSANGTVVVGRGRQSGGDEAFRWTEPGGMEGLGTIPGATTQYSNAFDVSADGTVVVGASAAKSTVAMGFIWRESTGTMKSLGDLPGGEYLSIASAVSPNGRHIAGLAGSSSGYEACLWKDVGEPMGLGDFPGGDFHSSALAISGDGDLVGGWGSANEGQIAFLWTPDRGLRSLKDVLEVEYGLSLKDWQLVTVYDISEDGNMMVGLGVGPNGPEGWMVVIPEPASLLLLTLLALRRGRFAA